jgi:hypothetical protein
MKLGAAAVVLLSSLATAGAAPASSCAPEDALAAFTSFVAAFNRGDFARLDALFAQPPLFHWYSSNPPGLRRTAAAADRSTLIAYFRTRHRKRDRCGS